VSRSWSKRRSYFISNIIVCRINTQKRKISLVFQTIMNYSRNSFHLLGVACLTLNNWSNYHNIIHWIAKLFSTISVLFFYFCISVCKEFLNNGISGFADIELIGIRKKITFKPVRNFFTWLKSVYKWIWKISRLNYRKKCRFITHFVISQFLNYFRNSCTFREHQADRFGSFIITLKSNKHTLYAHFTVKVVNTRIIFKIFAVISVFNIWAYIFFSVFSK